MGRRPQRWLQKDPLPRRWQQTGLLLQMLLPRLGQPPSLPLPRPVLCPTLQHAGLCCLGRVLCPTLQSLGPRPIL